MAYKCRVCGTNDVNYPGDVCELCAISQDPYAASMNSYGSAPNQGQDNQYVNTYQPQRSHSRPIMINGFASGSDTNNYGGNAITPQDSQPSVNVYQPGQVPVNSGNQGNTVVDPYSGSNGSGYQNSGNNAKANSNMPLAVGITKNITTDTQEQSFIVKLFRTLFQGIPYTFVDDLTSFQVFPDYSGSALNSMGNACDQVLVYGKINAGTISENNEVEVYGHRDSSNNIIANRIVNVASGTTIIPDKTMSVGLVWALVIILFALLAAFVAFAGVEGIIWAVIILVCITNLPLVLKILGVLFGIIFSIGRRS